LFPRSAEEEQGKGATTLHTLDVIRLERNGSDIPIARIGPAAFRQKPPLPHLRLRPHEMAQEWRTVPESEARVEALRAVPVHRPRIYIAREMDEMAKNTILRRTEAHRVRARRGADARVIVRVRINVAAVGTKACLVEHLCPREQRVHLKERRVIPVQ